MARIYYGVAGEGRGHATRVCTIVEALRDEHEFVIYAPGNAFELLAPAYTNSSVVVRRIPGLRFQYTGEHRLDIPKTGTSALRYIADLPRLVRRLQNDMEREMPDLVITDFEPSLPRAAERMQIPYLSIDHQHLMVVSDLDALPPDLKRQAFFMGQLVRAHYRSQSVTVVWSFYHPRLKRGISDVEQVGALLRPEVIGEIPHAGRHVTAYFRRNQSAALMESLAACGCDVYVYGLGSRPTVGHVRFFEVDMNRFVEDLATSRALISTAGNQLVGEALFLQKSVLALPEEGNHEQRINGYLLQWSGAGMMVEMEHISPGHVRYFLNHCERFLHRVDPGVISGNHHAVQIINSFVAGQLEVVA